MSSGSAAGLVAARSAELDIWLVDLVAGEDALHSLGRSYALMPPYGSTAVSNATTAAPGHGRHQAARIALRALLAGYVGIDAARQPFSIGPAGKPRLAHLQGCASIEFSLSHCEAAALIAVSGAGAVGIDIEAVRAVRISPERRAMLEDAAALLAPAEPLLMQPDDHRFLQAWVRLEALAKATGEGISALLGRLGIRGRSLLARGEDAADRQPMLVRDLVFDGQPPWRAAIAGAHPRLGAAMPSPVVKPLPLDRTFLDELVSRSVAAGL